MKIYKFDRNSGNKISKFDSDFVMSRIIQTEKTARIGCMYLEEKGIIGYHEATVPQLLLIMNGEGYVRGQEDEYIRVQPGDAVFWEQNEWHETKTQKGLTAIVIESEELNQSMFMKSQK